jgi:FkbM family methyltransferase
MARAERAKVRCALAVLSTKDGDPDRLLSSVGKARAVGLGDLADIVPLALAHQKTKIDFLRKAADAAAEGGFDWLLVVSAAETLSPDTFVKSAPALRVYDAVWGGAGVASAEKPDAPLERITRLAAQDLPTFFHAALQWWIGPTHFVRPDATREALHRASASSTYADYMIALWRSCRAYKTAQRLTISHEALPPLAEADRARLIEHLEESPVFMPVRYGGETLSLSYTGLNPLIEREQMRGLFFEQEELSFLAERLPRGLRIVDVGANTGNHTLFFAAIMQAERVIPVEPHPRAVSAINAVVAENRLTNVDLSRLGRAAGSEPGRLMPVTSKTAGLGATHYVADSAGSIPLVTLDDLISDPVDFLKIDVEGMEMAALAGAARLIARNRPSLYVEVVDEAVAPFMSWVDENGYRVEKLFPDKSHCNYLLVPGEGGKVR